MSRHVSIAREIASAQDKAVDFKLAGESVEVDKSLLDNLFEPLIHLIRNAVDHAPDTGCIRPRVRETERSIGLNWTTTEHDRGTTHDVVPGGKHLSDRGMAGAVEDHAERALWTDQHPVRRDPGARARQPE